MTTNVLTEHTTVMLMQSVPTLTVHLAEHVIWDMLEMVLHVQVSSHRMQLEKDLKLKVAQYKLESEKSHWV